MKSLKKVILAPDSFKGTISAQRICEIWTEAINNNFEGTEIISIPMADGGEGMVDSYLGIIGGKKESCTVNDPLGRKITAEYGIIRDGVAVMEMAASSGLPLMGSNKDIMNASTYGVGEMILDASKKGITEIIMGIGGSATNDCGIGMASALGYKFLSKGAEIEALPKNMNLVDEIIRPKKLPEVKITAACDVKNLLYGKNGATAIFGPQKGADKATLPILEQGITNMATVIEKSLGVNVHNIEGGGAAGGLGAGLLAFLGGELLSGIDLILNTAGFDQMLEGADLVVTGEGRMDGQSVNGKVPFGIGTRAMKKKVPCVALCGSLGDDFQKIMDFGISACFSATKGACTFEEIKSSAEKDLFDLSDSFFKTLKI